LDGETANFQISGSTGVISTKGVLHFETKESYTMRVTTSQGKNSPPSLTTAEVLITVIVSIAVWFRGL